MLIFVISLVAVVASGILYTRAVERRTKAEIDYNEREADRRWCELLITLDGAYEQTPPSTPSGRKVADEIHELRSHLGCE